MSPQPAPCRIGGCRHGAKSGPVCRSHLRRLPDDIRERLRWADGETDVDLEAALHEAETYLL